MQKEECRRQKWLALFWQADGEFGALVDLAGDGDFAAVGFDEGALPPPAIQTWPFAQAVAAYEAVAKGGAPVKHVLVMT